MKILIENVFPVDGGSFDGTAAGSLLVDGNRIAAVNPPPAVNADQRIDGGGRLLAPAFIDAHGHSDISALADPECAGRRSSGFRTEIAGNCGLSAFPLTACNRPHLERLYRKYGIAPGWHDYQGFRAAQRAAGVRMDIPALCGHNTLRAAVAGYEKTALSPAEIRRMHRLLEESLEQGAPGLSTGLLYVPGKFADDAEISGLMRILARFDRIYATHLRSEGDALLQAVRETIGCAVRAGLRRIHLSHLKTAGERNWHKLDELFALLAETERRHGLRITFDRYPYIESMTQLSVIGPDEWLDVTDAAIMELLKEACNRRKLFASLRRRPPEYWEKTRLAATADPEFQPFAGLSFAEIARRRGSAPEAAVAELLERDAVNACGAFSGMCRENMLRIITDPRCCCGTDESVRPADGRLGRSHPRNFGSGVKFYRELLEAGLPHGEIVRKLSGLPAEIFGLSDRGRLAEGCRAELLLIAPEQLSADADFADPHRFCRGIELLDYSMK